MSLQVSQKSSNINIEDGIFFSKEKFSDLNLEKDSKVEKFLQK